uniref:Uncharacterized protein n=1 Tax=Oryza punctata TaxID=4537 RepID=A0A0E0M2R6_ORYPU
MAAHEDSVVRVWIEQTNSKGKVDRYKGTGFIVFSDPDLCLIMSCGRNFSGYRDYSRKDVIHAEFNGNMVEAEVVFIDVPQEVSVIRVDRTNTKFRYASNRPPIHWSINEAPLHQIVAILSYMHDPEGLIVYNFALLSQHLKSTYAHSTSPRAVKLDYASVPGNSGSVIVNRSGAVGIHIGAVQESTYFLSLAGVRVALKEQVAKCRLKDSQVEVGGPGLCATNEVRGVRLWGVPVDIEDVWRVVTYNAISFMHRWRKLIEGKTEACWTIGLTTF